MLDDDLAAPEPPLDDAVGDALRLLVRQQRKERDAPDEIEVREHRHLNSLSGCGRSRAAVPNITPRAVTLLSPLRALMPPGSAPMSDLRRRFHTHPNSPSPWPSHLSMTVTKSSTRARPAIRRQSTLRSRI